MPVSVYSFKWTAGIGLPLLLIVYLCVRGSLKDRGPRIAISVILALSFTPTIWSPFDKTYVEAAGIVLFCGMVGLVHLNAALSIGGVPVALVSTVIYMVWTRRIRDGQHKIEAGQPEG